MSQVKRFLLGLFSIPVLIIGVPLSLPFVICIGLGDVMTTVFRRNV